MVIEKNNSKFPACSYPWTHFEVSHPMGDVCYCCHGSIVVGNINKQSIAEIWNGSKMIEVRTKILEDVTSICPPDCVVLHGARKYEDLTKLRDTYKNPETLKNAKLNISEIEQGKIELQSKPRYYRFSNSLKCNLKCEMCSQGDVRSDFPELELPEKFYNDLESYYPYMEVFYFFGGEPLYDRKSRHLLINFDYNKFPDCKVFIATNGILLNEKLLRETEQVNWGIIFISIDSSKKETFEKIRGGGKWELVLNGIKRFREKPDLMFFSLVICRLNYKEILDFIDFSRKLNMDIQFCYITPVKGVKFFKEYIPNRKEIKEIFEILDKAIEKTRSYNMHLSEYELNSVKQYIQRVWTPKYYYKKYLRAIIWDVDSKIFSGKFFRKRRQK